MIKKSVLIISLLIAIMFIAGCAVSDYLVGNVTKEDKVSDNKEVSEGDILKEIEELTKEKEGINETDEIEDILKDIEEIPENVTEEKIDEIEDILKDIEEVPENVTEEIEEVPEEAITDLVSDKDKYAAEEIDYSKDIVKLTVKENEEVRLKPNAEDADLDALKFTFSEPFDKDGYWKTDYGDAGEYEVKITVSDGVLTTSRKVVLKVERVNVPPVIDIVSDIEAKEGDLVRVKPKVTDPNGDKTTIEISDPVGNDGEWQTSYTDHGTYTVEIGATDGELKSSKDVKLVVKRKNMPPEIKGVPDTLTVNEGDKVEIKPEVTDLNEDKITLTISEPVGNDGIWQTGYTDHGEYEIKVSASDGEATTTKIMKLAVKDINKAPLITDIKLG